MIAEDGLGFFVAVMTYHGDRIGRPENMRHQHFRTISSSEQVTRASGRNRSKNGSLYSPAWPSSQPCHRSCRRCKLASVGPRPVVRHGKPWGAWKRRRIGDQFEQRRGTCCLVGRLGVRLVRGGVTVISRVEQLSCDLSSEWDGHAPPSLP